MCRCLAGDVTHVSLSVLLERLVVGWAGLQGYSLGGQGRKGQGEGWRLKWWTGREEERDVMREPMRRETDGG